MAVSINRHPCTSPWPAVACRAETCKESRFADVSEQEQAMIQKFLARTLLFSERMMDAVGHLGLPTLDVETTSSLDELSETCLAVLGQQRQAKT